MVILLVITISVAGCANSSPSSSPVGPSPVPSSSPVMNTQNTLSNSASSDEIADLFNRAHELNNQGKFEEAITVYKWVLQKDPDNGDAWSGTSYAYYRLGRLNEALSACDKALEFNPRDALLWTHKGHILSDLGRKTEATDAYTRATQVLQEKPDSKEGSSVQGSIVSSSGDNAGQKVDTLLTCTKECFETKNVCMERCVKSEKDSSGQEVCILSCRDDENGCNQHCNGE